MESRTARKVSASNVEEFLPSFGWSY